MRTLTMLAVAAVVSVVAPLAGLALAGRPLAAYLEFPPHTAAPIEHAPFSWIAFALLSIPVLAALIVFSISIFRPKRAAAPQKKPFPWWGWMGVALSAIGWVLAWKEGLVPPEWRRHTFSVLWLGYILAMNALTVRRGGQAPLTHRTAWFLGLFPASAALWWLFEYLNQFVANWHYAGVEASGAWEYFLQATLPFATVLPALASTQAWLARPYAFQFVPVRGSRALAWSAVLVGAAVLGALPLWPEILFPMLWLAPALVLGGLRPSYFAPLERGDWRCVLEPAAAALVCGFFWELWNWGSLAKWHYSIPRVERFRLFEMPLLGYAGYLPFGVACALVMDALARPGARARGQAPRTPAR